MDSLDKAGLFGLESLELSFYVHKDDSFFRDQMKKVVEGVTGVATDIWGEIAKEMDIADGCGPVRDKESVKAAQDTLKALLDSFDSMCEQYPKR